MLQAIISLNTKLINFFELPVVKYGFLILVVLRIISISYTSEFYLLSFESMWVKVLFALLISYSACFDPVYAIALTTLLIISIQELHRRKSISKMSDIVSQPTLVNSISAVEMVKVNDANVFNEINKHSLQKTPESGDSILAEYDYYMDPAYKNLTQTVREQNILRNGSFYITDDELKAAQTNQFNEANQGVPVQAFKDELNAQGIPNGWDKGMSKIDSRILQ
jgi:hypothetical protein